MARPRKYTDKKAAEALIQAHGFVSPAAESLGINRRTLERYIARSATLQKTLEDCRERALDIAELRLLQAINEKQAWAVCFFLKCRGKHRGYVERQELTGADGAPLQQDVRIVELPDNGRSV